MLIYNSVSVSLAIRQANSSTLDLVSHEMEKLCYRKFRILNKQHDVILVAESHCKSFLQYLAFALRANDHTSVFFTGCPKRHLRFSVQCGMNVLQGMLSQAARAQAPPASTRVQGRNATTGFAPCGCRSTFCYLLGYIDNRHQGYDSKTLHRASAFPAQAAKGRQNQTAVADKRASFPGEDPSKQPHLQIHPKCTTP